MRSSRDDDKSRDCAVHRARKCRLNRDKSSVRSATEWAIERKLAQDVARPIILYDRFATCWQPYVKGPTMMVDSIFNSNRGEDWWLDK